MKKELMISPALAAAACGLLALLGGLGLCLLNWKALGWALTAIALLAVQALGTAHDRAALARRRNKRRARIKAAVPAAGTSEKKAA